MSIPSCPFCDILMSEVKDKQYPKLKTFLCYGCGYSIDECLMENKELSNAYERLFYCFSDVLKPKELGRYQPKVNTNNTTDKETEPAIRNCYLFG